MATNHHDTGYKELFSYPEFVQQLVEGFAPSEIAQLMDFSTLKNHSGNYITPLFEEKFEDVVWSVEVTWEGVTPPRPATGFSDGFVQRFPTLVSPSGYLRHCKVGDGFEIRPRFSSAAASRTFAII